MKTISRLEYNKLPTDKKMEVIRKQINGGMKIMDEKDYIESLFGSLKGFNK